MSYFGDTARSETEFECGPSHKSNLLQAMLTQKFWGVVFFSPLPPLVFLLVLFFLLFFLSPYVQIIVKSQHNCNAFPHIRV